MTPRLSRQAWTVCGAAVMFAAAVAVTRALDEPPTSGGPATFRRLNGDQYARAIQDAFGSGIKIPGRFEPPMREEGLLAIGDGKVAVSSSGFEQAELRAREIAAQVLAADRRKTLLTCTPRSADAFDAGCARAFLTRYGRRLFRRPLADDESASVMKAADGATAKTGNFYKGLEAGLIRFLVSPNFLFRVETTEAVPGSRTRLRLDDYSLATRVSFLLWNAPPDDELLDAAGSGALRHSAALDKHVDRMIASPRFEEGVRAFFSDMFAYDQFDGLTKDQSIYPKFTSALVRDVHEQLLKTIVDLLVTNRGDYRDLFTTRKTFLNRNLGSLYKVHVRSEAFNGWMPYTFTATEPRAGILTLAGVLMLDPTHEGRSSPTIRGKNVRELFLCQPVPPPPGNVDFKVVQETDHPVHKTARERLQAHRNNPSCSGCHAMMDPIGLAMENYDALGNFRTHENGVRIDASGAFENKKYTDLVSLQKALRDSPAVSACAVRRTYEYGVGRRVTGGEREWLKYAAAQFAEDKYVFPALMRRVATSQAFRAVSREE